MDLKQFREGINAIDDQILELLAACRRKLVASVVELKEREDLQSCATHIGKNSS